MREEIVTNSLSTREWPRGRVGLLQRAYYAAKVCMGQALAGQGMGQAGPTNQPGGGWADRRETEAGKPYN